MEEHSGIGIPFKADKDGLDRLEKVITIYNQQKNRWLSVLKDDDYDSSQYFKFDDYPAFFRDSFGEAQSIEFNELAEEHRIDCWYGLKAESFAESFADICEGLNATNFRIETVNNQKWLAMSVEAIPFGGTALLGWFIYACGCTITGYPD